MPSAVTPSGDGQSLTRCILVIAVSFLRYTETSSVHLKINGGTTTATKPKQGKKEGRKEGREGGREEGRQAKENVVSQLDVNLRRVGLRGVGERN